MGRIWQFGDSIDTDVLAPGQYMKSPLAELAAHCLEAVRPEFAAEAKQGDIVLAGNNFGVGSSIVLSLIGHFSSKYFFVYITFCICFLVLFFFLLFFLFHYCGEK